MYRSLEKNLGEWKTSRLRYPLLLRGARQVGKTYLIERFGKEEFSSFVSVNFEAQPEAVACFATLDPEQILIRLQAILKTKILPGETLLFLDEIQNCPKAIQALRYFKEKLPTLHIIGAGSLLEFALSEGAFSFPVGRIQFMYLKPLSFWEFLLARRGESTLKKLSSCSLRQPPSSRLHEEMLQLVREYGLVGGMPAAVSALCESLSFEEVGKIQEILLSTYQADFSKYATASEQKYLKTLFAGIFSVIGEQFKYAKIHPEMRSRELKVAMDHLQAAGLIHPVYASTASGTPLSAQIKFQRLKVLFIDIGLAQHALKLEPRLILDNPLSQINRGMMVEQFVGQELLAYSDPLSQGQLFFWQREKRGSHAEVDYLTVFQHRILPIEVKAGPYGKLKSLQSFMDEKGSEIGIQISQKPLGLHGNVLSVPLYLIHLLDPLIQEALYQ